MGERKMIEILQYIFSSFWIWLGVMFLIWQIGFALAMPFYYVYKNLRLGKEQFQRNAWLATAYNLSDKKTGKPL